MSVPVILVEATPRRASDGVPVTVRLAGNGSRAYYYSGQHFRAGLTGLPRSVSALDFDGTQLGGGGVAQALEVSWAPSARDDLAELAGLMWTDAPITVRVGPDDSLPPVEAQGLVLDASVEAGALRIALADAAADLKRPLLVDRYAGTGGVEGPAEFEGQLKPRAWGRCFNVPGRPIDPSRNIWAFGDPSRPWNAIVQVRDKGVAASPDAMTLLPFAGTAGATFAALQAVAVPTGGAVVCPSIACVRWWTAPAGDLHADIQGEIGAGYVETAPAIAERIVAARSNITMAQGTVAAASTVRPAAFGFLAVDEGVTAASALSEILGDVSTSWCMADGAIELRPWDWAAPTRSIRSHRVGRREVVKPWGTRRLGYRRNHHPMARGDLAAIVLASEVAYEDGTPIEDLKPAQPGADVTGDNVSKDTNALGGRPTSLVLSQIDTTRAEAIRARAETEIARLRDRAIHFPGPNGETHYTMLVREVTRAVEADTVTAETFDLLGARTPDGQAFILDINTVRVSPTESFAQRFADTTARLNGNEAYISMLEQAFVTAGTASALRFTAVEARVGTAEASITDLSEATANDREASATRFTAVEARVGDAEAGIVTNAQAIVNESEARSALSTAVNARFNGNEASISELTTTFSDFNQAYAQNVLQTQVRFGQTDASIIQANTAIANENQARVQQFNQISGRVGQNEASITEVRDIVVTPSGAQARAQMLLDVNGRVTGYRANNNGQTGRFDIVADQFGLVDPATGFYYLVATPEGMKLRSVEVDTLKIGAMDPEFVQKQDPFNGYEGSQMLPGGIVMKWGRYRGFINSEVQLSIVFYDPFPIQCDAFVPTPYLNSYSNLRDLWLQNVGSPTRWGATVATQAATGNEQRLDGFDWIAFGR